MNEARARCLLAIVLCACGHAESVERRAPPEPPPEEQPMPPEEPPRDEPAADLRATFVLDHPTMRAGTDPDVDVEARLDGAIIVENTTDAPMQLRYPPFGGFSLTWTIRARDGGCFEATFLPPPVPRPAPDIEVTVPAHRELELMRISGVSGYRRCGQTEPWLRQLPAGDYDVILSDIAITGRESLTTAPARLIVR